MTRQKPHKSNAAPSSHISEESPKLSSGKTFLQSPKGKMAPYVLTFICLFLFSTLTYGDVFTRIVQESFITSDSDLMKHLTDQDFGQLYLLGRYLLLVFHSKWIGGLLLSLLLTATAFLIDYIFRTPRWLRGIGALCPFALIAGWVNQGIKIYYRSEPSLFVLQALGLFVVAALLAAISHIILKKIFPAKAIITPTGWRRWSIGSLLVILGFTGLQSFTTIQQENTILTARMQNRILENDTYTLIDDALGAKQPSRSVAAYYAIGLQQSNQLLDHLFDISFNFPDIHLKEKDGSGEFGIFNADCNFYAGLINSSYRSAMDQIVMTGPRLYYLKRMAICAILNQEKELANKYLTIISKVPFESEFIETYQPMVDNYDLVKQHYSFSKVLGLAPSEETFEQNYRSPAFLGYNVGMLKGSTVALAPSMAACMYSKDLNNLILRAAQYKLFFKNVPMNVEEAIYLQARKDASIFEGFPELNPQSMRIPHPAVSSVNNFFASIQSYYLEKYKGSNDWIQKMTEDLKSGVSDDLRQKLFKEWRGHYVYYYYCENITKKDEAQQEKSGVN